MRGRPGSPHYNKPVIDVTNRRLNSLQIAGSIRYNRPPIGSGQIDEGARTLRRFAERIDTSRSGAPAVLGVITSTGYAYVREDGIGVIPIGVLGP